MPISPAREQTSETTPIRPTREATGGAGNLAVPLVDLTERDDVRPTTTFQPDANDNQSVDEVVEGTVQYCQVNEIHNPVEILRCFQQKLVTGRALEVASAIKVNEGDTNFIMVDRCNLSETAFEEIVSLPEYRKTLQVQFYGEEAEDYGGPRKEFFRLVLKEIKEAYFDGGLRELLREKYFAIGIILGLSIAQNGKIPHFLGEDTLKEIFSNEDSSKPCITELQNGLKKVGIYQLGCQLPILLHLLKPGSSHNLTVRNITVLFKAEFSEEGSNKRKFENEVYSQFMKYIREVASGRRSGMSLAHILQFATGAEEEPVLGFTIHPSIIFIEATTSFLPTANTCICCLKLPHPTHQIPLPTSQQLFSLYDLAFSNAFFGKI